jgi:formate dehydrogenase subunit delta
MLHNKLATMANQIGRFFESQKSETAVAGIEDHLMKFWDPRMRNAIVTQLAEGKIELDPPVRAAVERLKGRKNG